MGCFDCHIVSIREGSGLYCFEVLLNWEMLIECYFWMSEKSTNVFFVYDIGWSYLNIYIFKAK